MFAMALRKNNIPFELHVYPDGKHGLGMAPLNPHVATWLHACESWLKTIDFI